MTADEFSGALINLGWKQADLCRRVAVTKSTASRWGQDGPPAWVGEYLGVMLELDRLHRLFVRPPKPEKLESGAVIAKPVTTGRAARMARKLEAEWLPGIDSK